MGRVVRPGSGDHRMRAAELVDRNLVEREPLVVGQRRRLTRRPCHDDAVGPVLDEMAAEGAEPVEVDGTVGPNGVTTAVRTSPSIRRIVTAVRYALLMLGSDHERKEDEMLREFKDFLMKGNIVDLAVAFVMGVAFAAVVNSFVNDLIMPIIAMIFGKPSFNDLTFTINDAVFRYGAFITAADHLRLDRSRRLLLRRQADGCDQGAHGEAGGGDGLRRGAAPPGAARSAAGAAVSQTEDDARLQQRFEADRQARAAGPGAGRARAARRARTPRARSCRGGSSGSPPARRG